MKKFFTLILLLGLSAITATAQPSALFKGKEAAAPAPAQLLSQQPVSYAAPMKRAEAITEQPAGIVHDNLYRFSASYEASQLGKGVFRLSDGVVSTIVEGDDGYLYLKDPFSRFAYGSWIKGKLEGDTVTFEFPQFMYTEQSGGFTLDCYVSRMILNDDASSFVLDPNRQDMKFLWNAHPTRGRPRHGHEHMDTGVGQHVVLGGLCRLQRSHRTAALRTREAARGR